MNDPGWVNFGCMWRKTTIFSRTPAWKCKLYGNGNVLSEGCIVYRRDHIWIQYIETHPAFRKKGYATLLMQEIIAHAPRKKRYLRLTIIPFNDDPMNRDQLRAFYAGLGFVGTRKRKDGFQIWEFDTRNKEFLYQ
jgi:GNAT superfamily N-acetyltransferase